MRRRTAHNMGLARAPSAKASTTSLALLSLALVLLASPPGVEASRARRRHPIPELADHNPSLASAGLTREGSSIPGVSIWTSKNAASASEKVGYPRDALSRRMGDRGRGDGKSSRVEASRPASRSFIQARDWAGDSQVGRIANGHFVVGKGVYTWQPAGRDREHVGQDASYNQCTQLYVAVPTSLVVHASHDGTFKRACNMQHSSNAACRHTQEQRGLGAKETALSPALTAERRQIPITLPRSSPNYSCTSSTIKYCCTAVDLLLSTGSVYRVHTW